jgi:hypothetical protein
VRLSALLLSLFALIALSQPVQAGRMAALVNPDPVTLPAGLSEEAMLKDLKRALLGRGWQVEAERPGEVDAILRLRDHVAKIRIAYTASDVRIAYVDSTNLDYKTKKGKPFIHRNYLSWVDNIIRDFRTNLQLTQAE